MLKNYENVQKLGSESLDVLLKQLGALSKGAQAIAAEVADYSKYSFEASSAAAEKLIGAKSLEKAIEVQSEFAKSAYDGFVARASKLGSLYVEVARETYKPLEGYFAKASPAK
jgi:hypothetical protein